MKAIVNYGKMFVLFIALLAINTNARDNNVSDAKGCKPCAAAAAAHAAHVAAANAAKISIQAAHAALLAVGNKPSREAELDSIEIAEFADEEIRCAACQAIKQSIEDALAASLEAMQEGDEVPAVEVID